MPGRGGEKGSATASDDCFRSLVSGRRRGPAAAVIRGGLWAASVPYGWATRCRNGLYDCGLKGSRRVGVPVVSVGNLTLGGTGKTPCVETVARFFHERGRRVTILSRGYGGRRGRNDEALVLAENLPGVRHLQGRDRVALALAAVTELHSNVLVLDDGFQHRRLVRDLDIVLIDATEPWGHEYLFPRGLLRESLNGLRRAGLVVVTRCDQTGPNERGRLREEVARIAPHVPLVEARHRPLELVNGDRQRAPLVRLLGRPVAAYCGIGNPEAFRRTLSDLGAELVAFRTFPDHFAYGAATIEDLQAWAARQPTDAVVVTTQKDLVKICQTRLANCELWALRIGLHFETGQDLLERKLEDVAELKGQASRVA